MTANLPLLDPHQRAHTYCTYCPKLCRFSCPVSTVQGRETTTPWAKMTSLHHTADGNLQMNESTAATWWACTGCMRCRSHCEHHNDVSAALRAGRAEAKRAGVEPESSRAVLAEYSRREKKAAAAAAQLFPSSRDPGAKTVFVPGCSGTVLRPDDAIAAATATERLTGSRARVEARQCCGLPLLDAGDVDGFKRAAGTFCERVWDAEQVVFQDPGCLYALKVEAPRLGVDTSCTDWVHLSELAANHLDKLSPLRNAPKAPVRYHDPCRLGRGLGVYEPPRAVLERLLGQPAASFSRQREDAECSGAGGQLPRTDRATADGIARERMADHEAFGGGTIVTACPASAHQLGRVDANAVVSLSALLLQGLEER